MEKMDGKTMDIAAENIGKLKELFPEAFTEDGSADYADGRRRIDFEILKELLGEYVTDKDERYSFTWNGKSKARMIAQTPSTGTLRPCKEESVDWDTTQNIFIEGDNLEVLKLLQKSYHKKVKMIYIDPPYNTGNDFVYKDNFKDNIKNYKEITGQIDGEGRNLSNNPETSGRYHTDWLNMVYPRLKLARNLLKDDGVIFISIDDSEVSNLRKICDEIFGEENFLANVVWQKKYAATNDAKGFSNPDNDSRGSWKRQYLQRFGQNLPVRTISNPENGMKFTFETPYDQGKLEKWVLENRIIFPETRDKYPARKEFLNEYKTLKQLITSLGLYATKATTENLYRLFDGKKIFTNPKPHTLLKYLLSVSSDKNAIILDFFSGSATTAHAVMQLNAEDGGKRKFIMVQLPETTDKKTEAYKAGYKTIAEISKERIRRAAAKIKEELSADGADYTDEKFSKNNLRKSAKSADKLDLGFRVFKLDSTNIKPWEVDFDLTERTLEDFISNIKTDRREEDVLYEILLKYGLDLTLPITEHNIAGQKVFDIGMGALIICLSDAISLEVVEGIAKLKDELNPEIMRVVFKDSGFKDDVVKTNAVQILGTAGIVDVRSL